MGNTTPSKSKQKTLDNIQMIVGKISKSEELTQESVEDIDEKLGKKGLEDLVFGLKTLTDIALTSSNMLIAIAGYLFGDKSINASTTFSPLTNKIKNTEPILGDEALKPVDDQLIAPTPEGIISVIIEGIDGKNIETLIELITTLNSKFADDGKIAIESVSESILLLSNVVDSINSVDLSGIDEAKLDNIIVLSEICNHINNDKGFNSVPNKDAFTEFATICPMLNTVSESILRLNFGDIESKNEEIERLNVLIEKINEINFEKFDKTFTNNINSFGLALDKLLNLPIFKDEFNTDFDEDSFDEVLSIIELTINKLAKLDFSKFDEEFKKNVLSFGKTVNIVLGTCYSLTNISEIIDDLDEVEEFVNVFKSSILEKFATLNEPLKEFNDDCVKSVKNFNQYLNEIYDISKTLAKSVLFISIINTFEKDLLSFNKLLAEFISGNNGKGGLVMVINRINKIASEDLSLINGFFNDLSSIMFTLIKLGFLSIMASMFSKKIPEAINKLNEIITIVGEVNINDIKVNAESLHEFASFMYDMAIVFTACAICGILAIPAMLGAVAIKLTASMLFSSIQDTIVGLKTIAEDKNAKPSLKQVAVIVITIGLLLLTAALFGSFVAKRFLDIIGFGLVLGAFMIILVGSLLLVSKIGGNPKILRSLGSLVNIIVACALVMMLGALFMMTGLWKEALIFAVTLTAFIFMIMIPFVLMSMFMKRAIKGAKEIALLIVTCTLVMMLGALFMLTGLWKESLQFGIVITSFIFMILAPFIVFSKMGKGAMRSLEAINRLIITCTIVLLIGVLFMWAGFWKEALQFTVILSLFIWGVTSPFLFFGKNLKKIMPALIGLSILILVTSAALLIGAKAIFKYGAAEMIIFATTMVVTIGILSGIAFILAKVEKSLLKGVVIMGALSIICVIAATAFNILGKAFKEFGDWKNAAIMCGIMVGVLLLFGGLAVGLGALASIPFFWIGIGAMAAISGIILIFSLAIKNIADAAKTLTEASNMNFNVEGVLKIISGMMAVGGAMALAGLLPLPLIISASVSMLLMSKAISSIAKTVADVSNLKVATGWDKNGIPTGYTQLQQSDFERAANGVKTIITTLGNAIGEVYKENWWMFMLPSSKGNIFNTVIDSCTRMSKMISSLARSVANMANLKVATNWDKEGNPIGFIRLGEPDFDNAGKNIGKIISSLGTSLTKEYKAHPEMYRKPLKFSLFGGISRDNEAESPIERVINTASKLGTMMSKISRGVASMADLKVADKWDKDGNPIHYIYLNDTQIAQAAINTGTIISTLINGLFDIYNGENKATGFKYKTLFDRPIKTDFWGDRHEVGQSPIEKVIGTAASLGNMMSKLARGIASMAKMQVADKWDKNGNPIHYVEITPEQRLEAAKNVGEIVLALATAIEGVYNNHTDLFQNFWGNPEKSKIAKVIKSTEGWGDMIGDVAGSIVEIANLHFKDSDGKVVKIDQTYYSVNGDIKQGKLYKIVSGMLSSIGLAISNVYDSEIFDGFEKKAKYFQKEIERTKEIISGSANLISEVHNLLKDIDTAELTNKWENSLVGIYKKFNENITDEALTKFHNAAEHNFEGIKSLVTTINSLDVQKTDKFIELANEISELSTNLGNMGNFVDALNGRINDTLILLAEKLEFAANTIKQSDKDQKQRQSQIDKNTKKLESVMKLPMTITLRKEKSTGSSSTGGGANETISNQTNVDTSLNNSTLESIQSAVYKIKNILEGKPA
jgi:hypothetical protein